jgi:hypothetical protein
MPVGLALRLERLERVVLRGCSACSGRPKIIAFREGEDPPSEVGCPCGAMTIFWISQSPPSLDQVPETKA